MDNASDISETQVEDDRFPVNDFHQLQPTGQKAEIELAEADRANVMWHIMMSQPNANEERCDDWFIAEDVAQWLR